MRECIEFYIVVNKILLAKVYTVSECYALVSNFFEFFEVLEFEPGLVVL